MINTHYLRCTQENKQKYNRELKTKDGYKNPSTLKEDILTFLCGLFIFTPLLLLLLL